MDNFETTILISSDTSKSDLTSINNAFEKLITSQEGSIVNKEDWGLRDLAYKIKAFKKAFYFFYQINIEGQKIQDLKKNIFQNDKIIRCLFIKVKTHAELPTKILMASANER